MHQSYIPADDHTYQTVQLRQFLRWFISVATPVGLLEIIFGLLVPSLILGILGTLTLTMTGLALWARALAARAAVSRAITILCASFLGVILCGTLLMPILQPALLIAILMAVSLALPYLDRRALGLLTIVAGVIGVATVVLAQMPPLLPDQQALSPLIANGLVILASSAILTLTLLLLWQFSSRLRATLVQVRAANTALRDAQAGLETQVAERTAALQTALADLEGRAAEQARLLAAIEEQRTTIRELSVPVIPIDAATLVMPLIGSLDSDRLQALQTQALWALERSAARRLVIDITGVPLVDSHVAQGILAVVQAARLLGAEVTLVGIRPEVAQAIVGLGLELPGLRTQRDLQDVLSGRAIWL
jgi:rsbT co-antagonist protein RsbR